MALGKAIVNSPLEAENMVNKFWVNNYVHLVDQIKETLGDKEGRQLAYDAYHKAVFDACKSSWEGMAGTTPNAKDYAIWLVTDLAQAYELEIVEMEPESVRLKLTSCPWATLFREKGKEDTGLLFCEVDFDMIKDFNEITGATLEFERTKILMCGHDHCNHHIFVKK